MARGRKKEKEGKAKLLYLDVRTIENLKYLADLAGMSVSGYIDWVVERNFLMTDMGKHQETLKNEIVDLEATKQRTIQHIDSEIAKLTHQSQNMTKLDTFKKKDEEYIINQKNRFIMTLYENMRNERPFSVIKAFALNQSIALNRKWTPEELIAEASILLKNE